MRKSITTKQRDFAELSLPPLATIITWKHHTFSQRYFKLQSEICPAANVTAISIISNDEFARSISEFTELQLLHVLPKYGNAWQWNRNRRKLIIFKHLKFLILFLLRFPFFLEFVINFSKKFHTFHLNRAVEARHMRSIDCANFITITYRID